MVDEAAATIAGSAGQVPGAEPEAVREDSALSASWRTLVGWVAVLCIAASLAHVLLVFLHVAPLNSISKRYTEKIDAWVLPLFEQNWQLFAPNPESVNQQISARTGRISKDGPSDVSRWVDLSAMDASAVRHSVFPSHTAQNMLRRAWTSYVQEHGGDDRSHSDRARMMKEYLRNIAANRIAGERPGTFDTIQLRVVTKRIPPPAPDGGDSRPTGRVSHETRYLPWWKVTTHAR
ncbi:DUF5819 family protein [Streptomyces sp. Amel2xB2]|uniref:DUF5819 family protein n=1 Tax=Streptomyces sp. Amel2xB2 TaxID=1305829 RepID=UPI0021AD1BF8|nr:DUF5819 family protein [Streptomyces sp. Amel2xB2]